MLKRQRNQGGFSLIVALVALVIMSLAAVSLMRTVSSSTTVSGNQGYEQAAVTGADVGIEAAIKWLENNSGQATSSTAATCSTGTTVLACDQTSYGYLSYRTDAISNATLWTTLTALATAQTQTTDGAGNTSSYIIQRMCTTGGVDASSSYGCSSMPSSGECGSSKSGDGNSGGGNLTCTSQVYYRITVKTVGSTTRAATTYVQVMVAI